MKSLAVWLSLLLAALVPRLAQANLNGPYTADANTLFLCHIDGAAGTSEVPNLGTLGGNFYTVSGTNNPTVCPQLTTMLGALGYSTTTPTSVSYNLAMTNLTMPTAGGTASLLGYDANGDGNICISTAYNDAIPMSELGMGGTNNWTIEFLVQPNKFSTTAGTYHIMSTDTGGSPGTRGFQFKMVVGTGPTYTLQWTPVAVNYPGTTSPSINGAIPTTGDDAPVPGQWYHLAMSYDGTNVYMYWTHMNPNNGACHLISTTPQVISTGYGTCKGPLILGNYGRGVSATIGFPACYDELRISSVCRAANAMAFWSPAVSITQNPAPLQNVDYNGPVAFTVGASTTGSSLYYQWRFNSNNIAGATNTIYSIPHVAAANAGYYDCVVTNTLGYTNVTAESHVVVGAANFLGHRYSFTADDTDSIGGANGTNYGDAYVTGGQLVLDGTSGTYMGLPAYLFTGASGTALTVEFWATFGQNNNSAVVFDLGAQNTIGGHLEGYSHLCFTPDDATTGLPQARISASDLAVAQLATLPNTLDNQTVHVAVIYDPPDNTEAIYTNGVLAVINTNETVAMSAINNAISWVGRSLDVYDNEGGGPITPYFAGSIDEFRIYYGALNVLSLQQSDNLGPSQVLADGPVTFRTQPASSTVVAVGNTATFTATAVGYLPIFYQWYTNGVPVPGATNTTFSFTPALGDNNDQVVCYATNTIGVTTYSTNTTPATLLVVNPTSVIWAANQNDIWDTSTANWSPSGPGSGFVTYGPLDPVTFDDEFSVAGPVDLAQAVNPQSITVNSAGTYKFLSSNQQGSLTGPGTLTLNNSGTLILDVSNQLTGAVTINSGTLQIGNGDTLGSLGNNPPVTDNGTLAFNRTDTVTVGNLISSGGGVSYLGSGTVNITAQSTYSGTTLLGNGLVHLGAPENGGVAGPLGNGGTISMNGGWLQYSSLNSYDYSGRFNTAGAQALNVDTAGQNVTWATGLSGASTLTKIGLGALTLSGGNTYTGNTVISNGTLQVASLAGNLSLAPGTTLVLGSSNVVTTATLGGNLALNGAALVFDITNLANASTLTVAGNLSPSGVTTIVLANTNALPNGSYPLLAVSGTLGGSAANFSVASQTPKTYTIAYVPGTPNQVVLNVTGPILSYSWVGNGLYPPGGGPNYWDINTSTNWTETGSVVVPNYVFNNGLPVVFDDTAAVSAVIIPAAVSPSSVVINTANGYTFSGAGGISGSTGLTLNNSGTVALNTVNTYTGPTTINGGTLAVGADNALGSDPGTATAGNLVLNGGTLQATTGFTLNAKRGLAVGPTSGSGTGTIDVPGGQTLTYGGVVANNGAGTGGLTVTDTGTLSLSGTNTYTGATTVDSGELDVSAWGATTLGTVTVGTSGTGTLGINGGTLNLGGNACYVSSGGGVGVVNQTAGTVAFNTANLDLLIGNGTGSTGTYNFTGGTISETFASAARGIMIGVNQQSAGTFNLSGTGVLTMPAAELALGRDDEGAADCTVAFNQWGGAATVGYLSIGGQTNSTSTIASFNLTNGTFLATNFQNLVAAGSSSATIYLGGGAQVTLPAFPTPVGTVELTLDFTNGYLAPFASSTNYLSGLTTAALSPAGAKFNVASGIAITVGQTLQDLTAGGALTKSGPGSLTLTGTNTYTGATTVSNGTLVVSAAQSGGGSFTVKDGATLGVALSAGQPTLAASALTLGSLNGATNSFALPNGNPVAPVINVGTLTLNGVNGVAVAGTGLTNGQFSLIKYSTKTGAGSFSATPVPLPGGLQGTIVNNTANSSIDLLIASALAANPTNITATVSSGVLSLSWPQDHLGWLVQSNSVNLAVPADWYDISNTASGTSYNILLNPAGTNVFYRLRHP